MSRRRHQCWMTIAAIATFALAAACHSSKRRMTGEYDDQRRARAPATASAESAPRKRPESRERAPKARKDRETSTAPDDRARAKSKVNPMISTARDAHSTFAVDVDTGSYTRTRRRIRSGERPRPSSVRVEEFVNYFDYDYPEPDSGAFHVHTDAAPSPWSRRENRYLMRVGVQGKTLPERERKPVHLTFLVDVSGSMESPDKLGLAKRSLMYLTGQLDEEDTVAIATYAGRTEKILEPTSAAESGRITSAIRGLDSAGSTAMNSGLELAYKLALRDFRPDHVNRVVVLSDGDANVGPDSHQEILREIGKYVDEGVTLSTIGFGTGNYRDSMMEQLANNGNGNYYYIDGMDEARRIFGERLTGTLQVIAKDVKLQVEFDEETVRKYRLIGYENRDVADRNFRNERVDAGEIGAGHTVTALYELEVAPDPEGRLATVRVRHKPPQGSDVTEEAFRFGASDLDSELDDATSGFRFAAAVAGFAEKLRQSPYAEDLTYGLIEEMAGASAEGREDRSELVELVRRCARR